MRSPGSTSSFQAALIRGSPLSGKLGLANDASLAKVIARDANPLGAVTEAWYDESSRCSAVRLACGCRRGQFSIIVNMLDTVAPAQIMVCADMAAMTCDYDGVQSHADPVRVELTDEDRPGGRLEGTRE